MEIKRMYKAYLECFTIISIIVPKMYFNGKSKKFILEKGEEKWNIFVEKVEDIGEEIKYSCKVEDFIQLGEEYNVRDEYGHITDLQIGNVVRTREFEDKYYYAKDDLGAKYNKSRTTFKVWSPTATDLILVVMDTTNKITEYQMKRKEFGIWTKDVRGDLELHKYYYKVKNNGIYHKTIDPYAKASTINAMHSCIIDSKKLIPIKVMDKNNIVSKNDAIIYEISIRDFTIDEKSNIINRGKYLGLCEKGVQADNNFPTGIDYIKSLGVTHIQILPIFDFWGIDEIDNTVSYNWGYNPIQYNVPEGSYALKPDDPYSRINELRLMISSMHENGLSVVMDVVYNHVYNVETFPFDKLVPGYYYRYDENGVISNGSGCGNDLASERKMVRKFIVDSIKSWMTYYNIDGFRFDLMGLLDIQTMREIRRESELINKNVILYGEGWDMKTMLASKELAHMGNAYMMEGYGYFNDRYRDLVKGNTFDINDIGFCLGNYNYLGEMKFLLAGSIPYESVRKYKFFQPNQSINYIECHDNHTLWDKMKVALSIEEKAIRIKRQLLANTMLLLSQGIPFIHSGQEFFRTKLGVANSYKSPDEINKIDWGLAIENRKYIEYFKKVIKLRKFHKAFSLKSTSEIQKHMEFLQEEKGCIGYYLKNVNCYGIYNDIVVLFNGLNTTYDYKLPSGKWKIVLAGLECNPEGIDFSEGTYKVEKLSTVVFVR